MKKSNNYLRGVQALNTKNQDIYGGMFGSYPIHGGYGRFEILNWAVKFYIDALMLEESIEDKRS
jgi:hypothetical protein